MARTPLLSAAAVLLAASACTAGAANLYKLDSNWPSGIAGLNVSSITAVAVANGTSGATEVHVAQRGTAEPFILVFDAARGALLRSWGTKNVTSPHGLAAQSGTPSKLWLADIAEATVKVSAARCAGRQ
jgi:hypothetical protein